MNLNPDVFNLRKRAPIGLESMAISVPLLYRKILIGLNTKYKSHLAHSSNAPPFHPASSTAHIYSARKLSTHPSTLSPATVLVISTRQNTLPELVQWMLNPRTLSHPLHFPTLPTPKLWTLLPPGTVALVLAGKSAPARNTHVMNVAVRRRRCVFH